MRRFLGEPDRWEAVDHWANFTGKRTYYLYRVEGEEASADFRLAYRASLKRRKLSSKQAKQFLLTRKEMVSSVPDLSEEELAREDQLREELGKVGTMFQEALGRGYRTPHKG